MAVLGDLRVSIGANIQGFAAGMDRVERRIRQVETRFEGLSRVGGRLRGVGASITAGVGVPLAGIGTIAIKTSSDFQKSMNRVRALLEASGSEFKQLRDLAIEQGRSTVFSATESAAAMGFLAQAGLDTRETIAALPGALQLAAAGSLDLASAADIATNVLAGMQLKVEDLGRVNDKLALTASRTNTNVSEMGEAFAKVGPIASTSGQSLNDIAAALGALANQGIKGSEAGTGVRRILGELIGPSAAAKRAIADLGIQLLDAQGQLRPLTEILGEFERAQRRLGDQTQFTARLFEIFGDRGGPAMAALISTGSAAVAELSGKLQESEGFAQRFADVANQGVPKGLAEMKAAIETLGITIGEKLAPEILSMLESIKDWADGLSDVDRKTLKTTATIALWTVGVGAAITAAGIFAGAISNIALALTGLKAGLAGLAVFLGPGGLLLAGATALGAAGAFAVSRLSKALVDARGPADTFIGRMSSLDGALAEIGSKARVAFEDLPQDIQKASGEAISLADDIREMNAAFAQGEDAARRFFAEQQAGQTPDLPPPVQGALSQIPRPSQNLSLLEQPGRSVVSLFTEMGDAADEAAGAFSRAGLAARESLMGLRDERDAGTFAAGFLDRLRELEETAVAEAAIGRLNEKIRESLDLQSRVGEIDPRKFALGLESIDIQPGPEPAAPPGLVGILPDTIAAKLEEAERQFRQFLDSIGESSLEARGELESLVDIIDTGRLGGVDGTPLDPAQLERVRDILKDRLGFDELGAAIDPVEAKIKRIAETLRAGFVRSDQFKDLGIDAQNDELEDMRKNLEELELSHEFGIELDDTEEQIRRLQQTLSTGIMPLSGEQASVQALDAIRAKIVELTLAAFQQEIADAQGDAEELEKVWARIEERLQRIGAMEVQPAVKAEFDAQTAPPSTAGEETERLGVALQGLMPIFGALQSATANWLQGLIDGTKTAAEAAQDFGRAMLAALTQIISRLAVAAALALLVSAFPGGNGFGTGGVFQGLTGISGKAIGGSVAGDHPYLVGERGPELFVPHRSGFIIPNHQMPEARAAGGPVEKGRPFLVGEQGPEIFAPRLDAQVVSSRSTAIGETQRFRADPGEMIAPSRDPNSLEQVLSVQVALDDEGLLEQVAQMRTALEGQLTPEELTLQVAPLIEESIAKRVEDALGRSTEGLREIGARIEADASARFKPIPKVIEGIEKSERRSADRIEREADRIGEGRDQIERENSASTDEQIDTNLDSQGVLDTVQVDLGDAVEAINFAAGAALAAATINLIPLLAEGGSLSAGQTAIVGEKGPELFRPRVGGEVISNKESRRMMASADPPPLPDSLSGPAAAGLSLPPAARAAGSAFARVPRRTGQLEGIGQDRAEGLRGLAGGGVVRKGETVQVGEEGPELFLTNVPVFQGWQPPSYRDALGDERGFRSQAFLQQAKLLVFGPDLFKERFRSDGDLSHIKSEDKAKITEKAEEARGEFLVRLARVNPPIQWTAPVGGNLLSFESAIAKFAPLGMPQRFAGDVVFDFFGDPGDFSVFDLIGLAAGARALGGPVAPGMPFLVGERGPELFVPPEAGRILTPAQAQTRAAAPSLSGALAESGGDPVTTMALLAQVVQSTVASGTDQMLTQGAMVSGEIESLSETVKTSLSQFDLSAEADRQKLETSMKGVAERVDGSVGVVETASKDSIKALDGVQVGLGNAILASNAGVLAMLDAFELADLLSEQEIAELKAKFPVLEDFDFERFTQRALGGPVFPGQTVLAGERAAEVFMPSGFTAASGAVIPTLPRSSSPVLSSGPRFGESGGSETIGQSRQEIHVHLGELFGGGQSVVTVRDWDEFAREVGHRIDTVARDYVIGGR